MLAIIEDQLLNWGREVADPSLKSALAFSYFTVRIRLRISFIFFVQLTEKGAFCRLI